MVHYVLCALQSGTAWLCGRLVWDLQNRKLKDTIEALGIGENGRIRHVTIQIDLPYTEFSKKKYPLCN